MIRREDIKVTWTQGANKEWTAQATVEFQASMHVAPHVLNRHPDAKNYIEHDLKEMLIRRVYSNVEEKRDRLIDIIWSLQMADPAHIKYDVYMQLAKGETAIHELLAHK
jgi:hypothetical protein